jgi:ElaB/YqjD/DUF883 family membrane-anchored ribosome-binding protein
MSQNSGPVAPGPVPGPTPAEAAQPSRASAVKEKAAGAVSAQQRKAAGQLRNVAGGLHEAAKHADDGPRADLARQTAGKISAAASWLDERDPSDLLVDVRALARQRPWVFLAAAAAAGLVTGGLARVLAAVLGGGSGPAPRQAGRRRRRS